MNQCATAMRKAMMRSTMMGLKRRHNLTRKERTMRMKTPLRNLKIIKIRMALQPNHPHLHLNP